MKLCSNFSTSPRFHNLLTCTPQSLGENDRSSETLPLQLKVDHHSVLKAEGRLTGDGWMHSNTSTSQLSVRVSFVAG